MLKTKRKISLGFFNAEITKNSAKLLSSNFAAQAIGLLVYPVLTRLYSPDEFGLLNLFLSIAGVVMLFATAEYQYAIVLPKEEKKAVAVFQTAFGLSGIVTLICLLTVPFSAQIANLFNASDLSSWYFLLPIYVFLSAVWTLLNYWFTRHKMFGSIGNYQLSQGILNAGAKIGFGYGGLTNGGLLFSTILSPFFALLMSISFAYKKIKSLFVVDKKECRLVAREYANFPKFSLPRAVVNNLSGNLPILLLTPFFGLAEIGFLGMALTLAFRPINMISSSLYQVFFQRTSECVNERKSIMPFLRKYLFRTISFVLPLFVVLFFFLPDLVGWILGEGWHQTGDYICIMLPWLAMSVLVAPICYLSDVFFQQKKGLLFEIALIVMRLLGIVIGIFYNDFYLAIIGFCIGSAIVIFFQLVWYLSLVRDYEKSINKR